MATRKELPITHWSYSSLMSFLRNPLAWYKRYVEQVYDTPSTPASVVGRAAHVALQHFYSLPVRDRTQTGGVGKEAAIDLGLEYLRNVPDFEINFGKARSRIEKAAKRRAMEREYLQAISFYLERPPKHDVVGVEVKGMAKVKGIALPIKAVSDLVVKSNIDPKALDIVDHKFVDSFSPLKAGKTLFRIQAIFNYYTVAHMYGLPVRRFILCELKKSKNRDGKKQMRRYCIEYAKCADEFELFHRLVNDATREIARKRLYLPNPSDMFEGEHSFDIYRLGLN